MGCSMILHFDMKVFFPLRTKVKLFVIAGGLKKAFQFLKKVSNFGILHPNKKVI